MQNKTNEELISLIYEEDQSENAFAQLMRNLTPMMIKIGRVHLGKLHFYENDDYIQEGAITLWSLIQKRQHDGMGKFSNLFYAAFDRKCISLYRAYVLKNMVQVSESEDHYGYGYRMCNFVEDEYAKQYREKQQERNRLWREKKYPKASSPLHPKLTEEERKERARQRSREYYLNNKEKCREAKRRWYAENREYALQYQKAYDKRIYTGNNKGEK